MNFFVSTENVITYAKCIKLLYYNISNITNEDLYEYLMKLEKDYVYAGLDNFA